MADTPPPLPPKRRSCLIPALVALLIIGAGFAALWWWYNRPIQPVVLTPPERAVLEEKVEAIQNPESEYEPGEKEIVITERELNGFINHNTGLGESLKLELVNGAVHARVESDLDETLPVVGGRRLKARARFFVGETDGRQTLVLDDLTVWGVSLPNDWLGGIKGQDLLGELFGGAGLAGVESLRVERGRLVLRLAE